MEMKCLLMVVLERVRPPRENWPLFFSLWTSFCLLAQERVLCVTGFLSLWEERADVARV